MKKNNGFTLIELLIYIGILGFILVIMTGFFWNIALGYIKENSYQELQQNGRFVLTTITQETRQAKRIVLPTQGASSDSLALEMPDLSQTVFSLRDGKIIIVKNGSEPVELTTDRIIVSNLKFTNMSYDNAPGTLRIEVDFDHFNPGSIPAYQSSISLTTTISLFGATI